MSKFARSVILASLLSATAQANQPFQAPHIGFKLAAG